MNAQMLIQIEALLGETVSTVNPKPTLYVDDAHESISSENVYDTLDERLIPVWNDTDCIYFVNLANRSYFAFTPRDFKLQFNDECPIIKMMKNS